MLGYARLYWLCLAVRIDTVVVAVDVDTAVEPMLICRKMSLYVVYCCWRVDAKCCHSGDTSSMLQKYCLIASRCAG